LRQKHIHYKYMRNVGVIDIGSNTIKLLVANEMGSLFKEVCDVRLFPKGSMLEEKPMQDAIESIAGLIQSAKNYDCDPIKIVGTSAIREAENQNEFLLLLKNATGYDLQVLSGEEEAMYVAEGIIADPHIAHGGDFFAVDLGGGSLECIHYKDTRIARTCSLPLGAVRLMNHFVEDPSQALLVETQEKIKLAIYEKLDDEAFQFSSDTMFIGCGGAFSVARLMIDETESYVSFEKLKALQRSLSRMKLKERYEVPHLPHPRADVMPTALTIMLSVCLYYGRAGYTHSYHNLRYGLARTMLTQKV